MNNLPTTKAGVGILVRKWIYRRTTTDRDRQAENERGGWVARKLKRRCMELWISGIERSIFSGKVNHRETRKYKISHHYHEQHYHILPLLTRCRTKASPPFFTSLFQMLANSTQAWQMLLVSSLHLFLCLSWLLQSPGCHCYFCCVSVISSTHNVTYSSPFVVLNLCLLPYIRSLPFSAYYTQRFSSLFFMHF